MSPEAGHEDRGPGTATAPRALLLRVGERRWRVSGAPGSEVAACPPVARVPGAPGWLAGLVVHKGEALALVDAGVLLVGEEAARPRGRMLVCRPGGIGLALAVDDVDPDDPGAACEALDPVAVLGGLLDADPSVDR